MLLNAWFFLQLFGWSISIYPRVQFPYCFSFSPQLLKLSTKTLPLLEPQGRPGAAGGLRKYFSSAPPNFWWVNYIKKVCLAGESTYPKVPSKNQAALNSSVLVLLCWVDRNVVVVCMCVLTCAYVMFGLMGSSVTLIGSRRNFEGWLPTWVYGKDAKSDFSHPK